MTTMATKKQIANARAKKIAELEAKQRELAKLLRDEQQAAKAAEKEAKSTAKGAVGVLKETLDDDEFREWISVWLNDADAPTRTSVKASTAVKVEAVNDAKDAAQRAAGAPSAASTPVADVVPSFVRNAS